MKYKKWIGDNRGLILPLALLVFVILGALAAAILSTGGSEAQIASNHLHAVQAEFLAEAGLEHAFNTLRTAAVGTLTATALAPITGIEDNLAVGGVGNYTVRYQTAGFWTWRVVSTGTSAIGGSQQIRRAMMSTAFSPNDAIVTNGKLTVQGNTTVTGLCPNAHTNSKITNPDDPNYNKDLEVKGNATVNGTASATGTTSVTGSGSAGAVVNDAAKEPVPDINATSFFQANAPSLPANNVYQMKSNGDVLKGDGTFREHLSDGGTSTCGWRYTESTPSWKLSGGTFCDGTFYFEGSAEVESNPGPWATTLIATGSITISGNPTIQTDNTHSTDCGSNCYTIKDTVLLAGADIRITGNPTLRYGMIAAREQVGISGNATITGFIVAQDASSTSTTVGADTETGSTTITYDCGGAPPVQIPLRILSWGL